MVLRVLTVNRRLWRAIIGYRKARKWATACELAHAQAERDLEASSKRLYEADHVRGKAWDDSRKMLTELKAAILESDDLPDSIE